MLNVTSERVGPATDGAANHQVQDNAAFSKRASDFFADMACNDGACRVVQLNFGWIARGTDADR
jgi:hypothetical protein